MASMFGDAVRVSIFGQSHSPAIGCSIDGLPAGIPIDFERLRAFLARRAPGRGDTATSRRETDEVEFIAGITEGHTNGAPIAAIVRNRDTRSSDYDELRHVPRPGHADWTASIKYGEYRDAAGGGHFSGRLTAPLCIAGGIALQVLESRGIRIAAHIAQLGHQPLTDEPLNPMELDEEQLEAITSNPLPCIDASVAQRMRQTILEAKSDLDSVGAVIECAAYDVPAGFGDPMFDGMENRIARIAFGIPGVKGVEFGEGFGAALMRGSTHNDPFCMRDGQPQMASNHAGGILGGVTCGTPLIWRMAVKPTPSIGTPQHSVDLDARRDAELTVHGRHDPCIAPRAVPVAEAACACAILDAMASSPGSIRLEDPHLNEL